MATNAEAEHIELRAFLRKHDGKEVFLVVGGVVIKGRVADPKEDDSDGADNEVCVFLTKASIGANEPAKARADLSLVIRFDRIDAWGAPGPSPYTLENLQRLNKELGRRGGGQP